MEGGFKGEHQLLCGHRKYPKQGINMLSFPKLVNTFVRVLVLMRFIVINEYPYTRMHPCIVQLAVVQHSRIAMATRKDM